MKKLMFLALAAVAAGVAQADNKAYVYKVLMDVKTTVAEPCSTVQEIECGRSGTNAFVRVADNYAIRGYIYGCHEENCIHLEDMLGYIPTSYSKAKTASASGIILWDALHLARVFTTNATPKAVKAWKQGRKPMFDTKFLNRISSEFDRSEFVFNFNAAVELFDAANNAYTNIFALTGAGFGVYDKDVKKGVWQSQSGAVAGTMSAPWYWKDGEVAAANQAYGMNCATAACGATIKTTDTAAYGTWTIEWDGAMAEAYSKSYSDALDVPSWVKWEE